jgi:hypothetical protein
MRLELQASPEEIREKSGQLLERLGEMLSSEVPEIAEMLEKALPKKEQELKYPVLQELAARTRELYAHQLDLMLQEIADVVIGGIGAAEEEGEPFGKALFIGPHGGKWADSAHTIHWTGDQPVSRQAPEPEAPQIVPYPEAELKDKLIEIGDALYAMQHGMHNVIDDTGFNHYDFGYWHSVRGNISGMKNMLKKYKGQIASHFGAEAYLKCGLHLVEKPKTSGFSIQPQYHDTFGSLYLPLNGFLKNDFKEYCEVQKKYGGIYDGNKKAFAISKLKLASFDFAAYKKDMAKFGIEVLEPLGTPAKATGPTAGEALTGDKIEEYIKGINAHQVTDVIVVRQRPDGIFEFYAPYAPAFNTLFTNKGGQISGITKYNPVTHARETFDLELTEEAIGKLTVLFPKWQIMTHGVKEARIKRDQDIAELQKPIPEVQAKLGPDLKLMSFQNECVRFLDKANGNALIGDEMGLGKALVNQTLTLTPKGWRRFGDLQVGDEVIDPVTGAAVRVSGVYPQGQRKVWAVKTRDGEVVECDAEHLWHVYTAMDRFRENEGKVRTTAQLLEEGMRTGHGKGQYRWYLPVALPQEFEYRGELPIDPYVLGVLIGDGAIGGTSVSWTKPDMEITERVAALLPAGCVVVPRKVGEGDCPTWGISGINGKNPVLDSLRELGLQGCLSPEKFIPERYLYASIEEREQLLAGLMDTDGDTPIGSCCIYSTSSRRLANDVIFLARSLGAIASLSIKRAPRYQHNGETRIGLPSYRVNIRAAFNPYSLERKAEHWEASSLARAIVDICPSEREEEMRCIAVESLQSTFIVQGHVVTHNTIQTLAWAAKNDKRVLVVCPKVVRRNWLEEAEKFFPNYFHGVELVAADLKKGKVPDLSGINIAAVNYESLAKFEATIAAAGFDTIVIDESHRIKSQKAQQTQTVQKIGAGMKHHILLSGTAVKNKKEELFTQLEMVAPGKFTKNAIKTAPIGGLWMDMHEVYIARQKTAVLKDLPEKTTSIVKHPVPGLPDMGEQNTIGAFSKLKAEIAKGKVPVTESMVQEILDTSDSKVIVFSDSVEAAKAIAEKFGDLAILHHGQMQDDAREAAKKEFQKKDEAGNFIGEKRVFVTTRQSMAVGATLTAADKVVFNDMPWTAADVRQAEDRAHRIGQKNAVNVYWMTAEGNLFDENVNDILRRKYELGQKLTQGKQLTAAEMEWMSKPISVDELLTQIHGKVAGPTAGGGAESAATSQVPALSDMDHPELAPNLPEPQTAGTEILPGSATVVEVPWQGVPSPSSGVDKPLTVEMFDKLAAEVKKESATPYVVDPAGIAASLEQAQKDTDTITAEYSGKLNSLAAGTTIHLGYGQSFTKVEIGGDVFWAWEGKGGKKKGYLASEEAYVQMGAKAVDTAVSAGKKPAPAPAYVPEPTAAPEKAPEAKPAVATPEPAPAPKLTPEQGSVPAQAFSGFIQEHGIKIKEHYGDPTKVMVKVPKHATEALAQLQKYGIAEPTFEGGQYHLVAVDKQKVKDLLFQKSLDDFLELDESESAQLSLFKAGMFIGPRGGKWADPEHTIPWTEEGTGGGAGAQPAPTPQAQTPQPPPQMGAPTPAAQIAPQMQSAPRAPQAGLTPPAGGDPLAYQVDPMVDADGDGVADAARVGLPGKTVAPPPTIPRLPNLTAEERAVEGKFADAFEADSDGMASAFYDVVKKNNFIFETDAAKSMMPEWTRPDLPPDEKGKPIHPDRAQARALYNTALHQTANAVVKRAFMKRLDEIAKMPEGERKILVTSGGVAGGKGSALGARPELAQSVAATWDAAGEQNGTENPWLMEECEKRGIKPVFLFVSADPMTTWPGAVDRAKSIGRMVDARLFADSYAHGAKNFSAFHSKNKDKATFVFAKAKKGDPVQFLDQMPPEALSVDADALYGQAMQYIQSKAAELPPHIVSGATAGSRIWGGA